VHLESGGQPVDHSPVHAQRTRGLGDRQPVTGLGEQRQQPQAAVERLRDLCGHALRLTALPYIEPSLEIRSFDSCDRPACIMRFPLTPANQALRFAT
jgi:hypothetical protein